MLTSIHPLGERGRGMRWSVTVAAYLAGSVVGGAVAGAIAGALGALARLGHLDASVRIGVLAAAALVAAAFDAPSRLRVPTVHRQVDEDWLGRYRGWVYGAGFGAQLGLGVVTIVTSASVYLFLVAALLSGSLLAGAVIGATFGLSRAVVLLAARRVDSPERLRSLGVSVLARARPAQRATVMAELVLAIALLVAIGAVA
jgi:hypothetical protein